MTRERIRAVASWRGSYPRYDCVFIKKKGAFGALGMHALEVGRVRLFFSFVHGRVRYPCALIEWFRTLGDMPDSDTGLWVVEPMLDGNNLPVASVVHINLLVWNAHLMPVFGQHFLLKTLCFSQSLDAFRSFFVNKHVDHHATRLAY
ncbi:hypothetical protein BOTBODRAFT_122485 [Botryobasidium botryosum FD-172 SS1]|uniref:Uncharacterized protein n=1 Tax=Botryobasidium botryosum (strain FD-172 SS1) TaxID=930990 RepID=A0A067M1Z1_BOTB1|nr:hypothetical protein BOTBODRAFT_122485 [Botryobasidium botryosum FD-172 SS1]